MQARPIIAQDDGSSAGTGPGGQTIITGTPTVGSTQQVMCACNPPYPLGVVVVSGTFSATLVLEASYNGGTTWNGVVMTPIGETAAVTSITTPGTVTCVIEGATNLRARCTAYSSGSANVALSPGVPPALPNPPSGLSIVPGATTNLLLWPSAVGATSYDVWRGTASGAETLLAGAQAGPTYSDTGRTANTPYYYFIVTNSIVGKSGNGAEALGYTLPTAPTSPSATGAASNIALSWTAPSAGAATYNVYRGAATGAESPNPIATGITTTSYTDINVVYGVAYYYVIRAVNANGGVGAASTEVNATATGQAAPTSLAATPTANQADLTWVAAAGALTYNLYRGLTSGGELLAPVATGLTGTAYSDTGLASGVTYYYKLTALSTVGQSAKSNEASAAINPPMMSEYVAEDDSTVYSTETDSNTHYVQES